MTAAELEAIGRRVAERKPIACGWDKGSDHPDVVAELARRRDATVDSANDVPALLAEVARLSTLATAERAYRVALTFLHRAEEINEDCHTDHVTCGNAERALIAAGGVP